MFLLLAAAATALVWTARSMETSEIRRRMETVSGWLNSATNQDPAAALDRLVAEDGALLGAVVGKDGHVDLCSPRVIDGAGLVGTLIERFPAAPGEPHRTMVTIDGTQQRAWLVRIPSAVQGLGDYLLVLPRPAPDMPVVVAPIALALLAVWSGSRTMGRLGSWQAQHVVQPLEEMRRLAMAANAGEPLDAFPIGRWREFHETADTIRNGARSMCSAVVKAKRTERRAGHRLRQVVESAERDARRARHTAWMDALTGLKNRRFLEESLCEIAAGIEVEGGTLIVVMLDLDNFKKLNDSKGHGAGDDLLRHVGELLRGSIRQGDHAVRYGGDEFVLLLTRTNLEGGQLLAERIVRMFGQYAACLDTKPRVGMSAGITTSAGSARIDAWALIAEADDALYRSKAAGKGTVRCAVSAEPVGARVPSR